MILWGIYYYQFYFTKAEAQRKLLKVADGKVVDLGLDLGYLALEPPFEPWSYIASGAPGKTQGWGIASERTGIREGYLLVLWLFPREGTCLLSTTHSPWEWEMNGSTFKFTRKAIRPDFLLMVGGKSHVYWGPQLATGAGVRITSIHWHRKALSFWDAIHATILSYLWPTLLKSVLKFYKAL